MDCVFDAIVVGGGVAGLYAARKLVEKGIKNVCVVEAQNRLGGRVCQVHGVAPWPLELGPEFLHGAKSLLVDVCEEVGMRFKEVEWPDHIFWGRDKQLVRACPESNEDFQQLDKLMFEELPNQDIPAEDMSIRQWMHQRGTPERVVELADVCYSNDFACSLHELGLTEAIIESRQWDAGEEYLLKDRSLEHLINHLSSGIVVRTGWVVKSIEWTPGNGATIRSMSDEALSCRTVVCAVPLSQLQNGSITFSPSMPEDQRAALQRVRMGTAVKVFGIFSERFWPEGLWDVVCANSPIPELWITQYPVEQPGLVDKTQVYCITAFTTGDRARQLAALAPAEAVQRLVDQLDDMFGTPADPRPAQRTLLRGYVRDWSKVPFVEGAYTHPTMGARVGDRALIARALGGVVFFAGEHCQLDMNPCLQGAMETGDRAAAQVYHVLCAQRVARGIKSRL